MKGRGSEGPVKIVSLMDFNHRPFEINCIEHVVTPRVISYSLAGANESNLLDPRSSHHISTLYK